ncbi:hypothetical protein A79_4579 [Vibrio parahaemolyticus AQ3810]|nr:hypothetical protein A79_4579 [Vibrio parahaemolyticus AQ3810]
MPHRLEQTQSVLQPLLCERSLVQLSELSGRYRSQKLSVTF